MFKKIKLFFSSKRKKYKYILGLDNAELKFNHIFKHRLWTNKESVSGSGSTLEFTKNIRAELPKIFDKFKISNILDAPCGDFNWMQYVIKDDINYIGGDIVKPLIEQNNKRYASKNISFIHLDITKDALPDVDLIVVRDCLFHLSYADISLFLNNLSKSNIKYILTTGHNKDIAIKNTDIVTGDYRPIDLFSKPFNWTEEYLYSIDESERKLYLFECEQLPKILRIQ